MPDRIALIGRARSGKDTVAARLVNRHGFTRVAFADRLKDALLAVDPIVSDHGRRLSDYVADPDVGWERAKEVPEVRRLLQHYGQTIREIDPGFWIRAAFPAMRGRVRVVVSDVRYRNEADALRAAGFTLVRVTRPGSPLSSGSEHISETELTGYPTAHVLVNGASVADLHAKVDGLTR